MKGTTALITHPDCLQHNIEGHPESPARLNAILQAIDAEFGDQLPRIKAPFATREQLLRAHSSEHVDSIFDTEPTTGYFPINPDTTMMPATLNAALRAAGAVTNAVDLVMSGEFKTIFCAVRPPGHHAEYERAMGFCFFNNIAVGVAHALANYDLQRIAIIDFDVHHGNGTDDIFRNEKRVTLFSSFQHPFYPGTPTHDPHALPLPIGCTGELFRKKVSDHWLPALHQLKPQLIFISAGFDAHFKDPLGGLQFTEEDYSWITCEIKAIAAQYAAGRIISTLEGGYDLEVLASSVITHIKAL